MARWPALFDLWSEHRARAVVVRRFKPLVERSRRLLEGEAEKRWTSDFGVGVFSTLAWLTARRAQPELGQNAMGLTQVSAWAELTGLDATNLGERITLLSLTQDREFANGCRAAILFDAAFQAEEAADPAWFGADDLPSSVGGTHASDYVAGLWDHLWQRSAE